MTSVRVSTRIRLGLELGIGMGFKFRGLDCFTVLVNSMNFCVLD